jgi:hypothetical protein
MILFNTNNVKKLRNQGKTSYVNYRIDIAEAILKHIQLPGLYRTRDTHRKYNIITITSKILRLFREAF